MYGHTKCDNTAVNQINIYQLKMYWEDWKGAICLFPNHLNSNTRSIPNFL